MKVKLSEKDKMFICRVGEKCMENRESKHITRRELSNYLDTTISMLYHFEHGNNNSMVMLVHYMSLSLISRCELETIRREVYA